MIRSLIFIAVFLAAGAYSYSESPSFNRDIRPILSDKCFACHGFDEDTRQAGLRLDVRDDAIDLLLGDDSEVLWRITSDDPDVRMPPPEFGKTVSDQEIQLLRQWIDDGAPYERHWAFLPIRQPELPSDPNAGHPIDVLIDRQLDKHGLTPNPSATPAVLARRVGIDLIGLQPEPSWRDEYVRAGGDRAYHRLVDRLLASPRFGEHQARFWLDAARYGDTHGMARDDERSIWPYRDWVVDAINRNMPFDQFTIEQLAGDLLPDATRDQTIATGFLRCNVSTAEGGSIEEELRVRYAGDRLETLGTTWLGLTVGCAACHDHKFDPISQEEYYELTAFFAGIDEEAMNGNALAPSPTIDVPSSDQQRWLAELESNIRELKKRRESLPIPADAWVSAVSPPSSPAGDAGTWRVLGPLSPGDNTIAYLDEVGPTPQSVALTTDIENAESRWEIRAGDEYRISSDNSATFLHRVINVDRSRTVKLVLASDETLWKPLRITVWLGDRLVHWKAYRQADVPFRESVPLGLQPGSNRLLVKVSHYGGPVRAIVRFDSSQLRRASDDPVKHIRRHVLDRGRKLTRRIAELKHQAFELRRQIPVTMIVREADRPRQTFVLDRGAYDKPQQRVQPRVPDVLPALREAGRPPDRLDLARWLVDPRNPLTARVIVNRYWQQLFGQGLVRTVEDFGTQGAWPTHPELLDFLAAEFIESGWDVKRLLRLLVTSEAYRRSSVRTPAQMELDPMNRWLSVGPRVRLSGEELRDTVLQAAGMLDNQMGGRGVKPPQPAGLWRPVSQPNSSTVNFVADRGAKAVRRSLYTFWKRTSPPPMMQTFDAPTRESCMVRRSRTNTPLQALVLMNDPQMMQAAKRLADRANGGAGTSSLSLLAPAYSHNSESESTSRGEPTDTPGQIFQRAIGRIPNDRESRQLQTAMEAYREYFLNNPAAVGELDAANADQAAEIMLAHTVLNLSEMVTKE